MSDIVDETESDVTQLQACFEKLSTSTAGPVRIGFEDLWDETKLKVVPKKLSDLLCTEDLLQLSLCSKAIKHGVRAALNKYKEMLLHIDLDTFYERDLERVKKVLGSDDPSKIVYSGLSLKLRGHPGRRSYKSEMLQLLAVVLHQLVQRMRIKAIRFRGNGWGQRKLMIQALQAINENVQAIDIKDCCVFRRGFGKTPFTAWTNNCQLNKLNQLHFDTPSSSSTKKAILEILANAPNLTTLDGPVELSWFANSSVANLLEGKIVERIQWDLCSTGPQRELIEKFVTSKPQLLEIQLRFEDFSLESKEDHITAILLSSLLESSKDTLQSLSANFANLVRFQKEKLLPQMLSLKVLIIHGYTSSGKCDDGVLIHLDALDYETLFPNLNRVEILLEQDDFLYPHEQESSLACHNL